MIWYFRPATRWLGAQRLAGGRRPASRRSGPSCFNSDMGRVNAGAPKAMQKSNRRLLQ